MNAHALPILFLFAVMLASAQSAAQQAPELEQKLEILEKAKAAGILTEAEYQRKKADLLSGSVAAIDEKQRVLEAARKAGLLTEAEFNAKLADLKGTAKNADAAARPPEADAPTMPEKVAGKTYRHPTGFSFWYPADWTLQTHEAFLQLVPPNAGMSAEGPTEIYLVSGENVAGEGIDSALDPRVAAYLDMQVRSLAPFLSRTSEPKPVDAPHGQGAQLDWSGTSPAGKAVVARSYVSIVKDTGVILSALCFPERLAKRDADLQRIFASFAFGEGKRDTNLVGTWNYLTTQAITNWSPFETDYSRAQLAADHTGTLDFRQDGTWTRTERTHMIAGAGGVWLEDKNEKTNHGTWFADGKLLYMVWEDNSWEDYTYKLQPSSGGVRLLLVSGDNGELWERKR